MEYFSPNPPPQPNFVDRYFEYLRRLPISDGLFLKIAVLAFFVSLLWLTMALTSGSRVEVATAGGSFIEGVVGTPRFVNPVLAVTRADRDLTTLIYDGLMGLGPQGVLTPNIAESVTISEDGLTYNVVLRKDVTFQDGESVTSKDVVFTVGRIQEPSLTSPLRAVFDGIVVEQLGDYELNFVLEEPYAPFIENLTFGILPEHIWKDASNEEFPFSQLNSEPVGAGPYMVQKINRTPSGIPESYTLAPHKQYHRGAPKIESITLKFFSNDQKLVQAFIEGKIDSLVGVDQSRLYELAIDSSEHSIHTIPLPRTFALFFNQNKSAVLRDGAVREALSVALDRDLLVDTVLGGYGIPIISPLPPGFGISVPEEKRLSESGTTRIDEAHAILRTAGWKLNAETGIWEKNIDNNSTPLSFSIATVNNPIFEATAEYIGNTWEKLGASVTIKQFEQSDLTQAIIRPRDYESLLFGTQVGRSLDYYSFWHSSQRNDPGLNIALYANITTDSILSQARTSTNVENRNEALHKFTEEIKKENPAIFLYTPELLYIFPNQVIGASFAGVSEPHERFSSIHDWYIHTESVWPIFKNEETELN
jgi:peptide/nickel transport system substrate-binding protein